MKQMDVIFQADMHIDAVWHFGKSAVCYNFNYFGSQGRKKKTIDTGKKPKATSSICIYSL